MVDTTSNLNMPAKNIVAAQDHIRMDQLDSVAAVFYGNIMSVIKLRH